MKENALADRDPELSALIDDAARDGAQVVLTKGGQPVAMLIPTPKASIGTRLLQRLDERARRHPETTNPVSWETLKADMDEDRG